MSELVSLGERGYRWEQFQEQWDCRFVAYKNKLITFFNHDALSKPATKKTEIPVIKFTIINRQTGQSFRVVQGWHKEDIKRLLGDSCMQKDLLISAKYKIFDAIEQGKRLRQLKS